MTALGPRKSLQEVSKHPEELEDLLRAFRAIQNLPHDNPDSFFTLASIHAAPYLPNNSGIWCHHGTILFPSWHRPYIDRVEKALRKHVPEGRQNTFRLPFWDISDDFPEILVEPQVTIDGVQVDNPLRSYTLPIDVIGRRGVLIPANEKTERGFTWIKDISVRNKYYLENIRHAVRDIAIPGFRRSLKTEEFKYFSNHTWDYLPSNNNPSRSLEVPHDDLHGFGGGYPVDTVDWTDIPLLESVPTSLDELKASPLFQKVRNSSLSAQLIDGWNNFDEKTRLYHWVEVHYSAGNLWDSTLSVVDTSAFDPLFYFHHCNIDRFYWQWQQNYGVESWVPDDPAPGGQPDPFRATRIRDVPDGTRLTVDTPLPPFPYTTAEIKDPVVLDVSYTPVTFPPEPIRAFRSFVFPAEKVEHYNQFVAHVWETLPDGKLRIAGTTPAFTRVEPEECPNCVANSFIPLHVVVDKAGDSLPSPAAVAFAAPIRAEFVGGIGKIEPVASQ